MKNVWQKRGLKRHLQRQRFSMPTTMNDDFEVEFEEIEGRAIPRLIEFWQMHAAQGSITREAYATIAALIVYAFERQSETNLDTDTLD